MNKLQEDSRAWEQMHTCIFHLTVEEESKRDRLDSVYIDFTVEATVNLLLPAQRRITKFVKRFREEGV